jgi:transposase-like protein
LAQVGLPTSSGSATRRYLIRDRVSSVFLRWSHQLLMTVCPSCGSSRIRSDYRPAPWYLRVVGVRALLCDYCNRQFRAFSWRAPKGRSLKTGQRKANVFLGSASRREETVADEVISTELDRSLLLAILQSDDPAEPSIASKKSLREQIAERQLQAQRQSEETEDPDGATQSRTRQTEVLTVETRPSGPDCPTCGSGRVRRRPRSTIERVALSMTRHRAYQCRDCQTSFYHRGSSLASEDGTGPTTDEG